MSNADKPAYPCDSVIYEAGKTNSLVSHNGLTKREMFVMAAMQGLCANSVPGEQHRPKMLIAEAIDMADELLKQLDKN